MFCIYYQAIIDRKKTWLLVGALRSCEGMVFERTVNKERNQFEFFVPSSMQKIFLSVMDHFIVLGIVHDLVQLPNRFEVNTNTIDSL